MNFEHNWQWKKENDEFLLMTLDAEKAFDLVSWPSMFEIMKSCGLDEKFCQWIQALYTNSVTVVKTNGTLWRKCLIQRGTRQGDIVSPLLFTLYTEVFARAIQQNKNIKGFKIGK